MQYTEIFRNYFLDENNYKGIVRPPGDQSFLLVTRFGELIRKLWNTKNFKAHVSPHEMLQVNIPLTVTPKEILHQENSV